MPFSFTAAQQGKIQHAIDLMVQGQAYETPLDSNIIEEVAKVFADSDILGDGSTDGDYREKLKLNPFSTLLTAALKAGM